MSKSILTRSAATLLVSAGLLLAACGGGTSASTDDISAKLKTEPEFAGLKSVIPAAQYDTAINCIAKYLHDKGSSSDVNDWIAGKKTLADVKGHDSEANATQTAKDCVTNAAKKQ